jgi:transcriptional regulator with XRE-family HTH domain
MPHNKSDTIDRVVATNIRLHRTQRGISQAELGEALGVSFQQIQKYEKGLNRVSASRLFRISQTLQVKIGDFFKE